MIQLISKTLHCSLCPCMNSSLLVSGCQGGVIASLTGIDDETLHLEVWPATDIKYPTGAMRFCQVVNNSKCISVIVLNNFLVHGFINPRKVLPRSFHDICWHLVCHLFLRAIIAYKVFFSAVMCTSSVQVAFNHLHVCFVMALFATVSTVLKSEESS